MTDFASCNYLGLDLHEEVIASIPDMLRKEGVHPSCSKAVMQPEPYLAMEARLAELIGVENVFVIPTGPVPTAAFASTLAALEVNRAQGDPLRRKLFHLTKRMLDGLRELGMEPDSSHDFPIVATPFGKDADAQQVARILMEEGIYVTLMLFPAVARKKGIIRATVTAANTEEEVEQFLCAMKRVRDRNSYVRGAA